MKIIRLLSLLALLSLQAAAVPAFVGSQGGNNSGTNIITINYTYTAGNAAVVLIETETSVSLTATVANSLSENFTQFGCGYISYGTTVERVSLFGLPNTGAATSVTVTWSGTSNSRVVVMEFSGLDSSTIEDATCVGNTHGTDTTVTSASYSTVTENTMLLMCVGAPSGSQTFTLGALAGTTATGFTQTGGGRTVCEYRAVSSTQSSITGTVSWNNSVGSIYIIVGLRGASGAPSGTQSGGAQII